VFTKIEKTIHCYPLYRVSCIFFQCCMYVYVINAKARPRASRSEETIRVSNILTIATNNRLHRRLASRKCAPKCH